MINFFFTYIKISNMYIFIFEVNKYKFLTSNATRYLHKVKRTISKLSFSQSSEFCFLCVDVVWFQFPSRLPQRKLLQKCYYMTWERLLRHTYNKSGKCNFKTESDVLKMKSSRSRLSICIDILFQKYSIECCRKLKIFIINIYYI